MQDRKMRRRSAGANLYRKSIANARKKAQASKGKASCAKVVVRSIQNIRELDKVLKMENAEFKLSINKGKPSNSDVVLFETYLDWKRIKFGKIEDTSLLLRIMEHLRRCHVAREIGLMSDLSLYLKLPSPGFLSLTKVSIEALKWNTGKMRHLFLQFRRLEIIKSIKFSTKSVMNAKNSLLLLFSLMSLCEKDLDTLKDINISELKLNRLSFYFLKRIIEEPKVLKLLKIKVFPNQDKKLPKFIFSAIEKAPKTPQKKLLQLNIGEIFDDHINTWKMVNKTNILLFK